MSRSCFGGFIRSETQYFVIFSESDRHGAAAFFILLLTATEINEWMKIPNKLLKMLPAT